MSLKEELQYSRPFRGLVYFLLGAAGVLAYFSLIEYEPYKTPKAFVFEDGAPLMVGMCFIISFLSTWLAHVTSDHVPGSIRFPGEIPRLILGPLLACSTFAFTLAFGLDFGHLNSEMDWLALALRTAGAMITPWPMGVAIYLLFLLAYYTLRQPPKPGKN